MPLSLPTWETLHPLVIHFPIGLLFAVPVFLFLALLFRKQEGCFLLGGLIVLALGLVGVVVAIMTGEAASLVIDLTPEISAVLEKHEDLVQMSRNVFGALAAVLTALLVGRTLIPGMSSMRLFRAGLFVYFVLYIVALGVLTFAAHQGAVLVHGFGVHAIIR